MRKQMGPPGDAELEYMRRITRLLAWGESMMNYDDFMKAFGSGAEHLWDKFNECGKDLLKMFCYLDLERQRQLVRFVYWEKYGKEFEEAKLRA